MTSQDVPKMAEPTPTEQLLAEKWVPEEDYKKKTLSSNSRKFTNRTF